MGQSLSGHLVLVSTCVNSTDVLKDSLYREIVIKCGKVYADGFN